MPVIQVNLVPPDIDQKILYQLVMDIQKAVTSIPELQLTEDDVTVLLPGDILSWGIGVELPVLVFGLFKRQERTPSILNRLWDAIGMVVYQFALEHVPQCLKVEVIPVDYDQERDGFWKREIKTPTFRNPTGYWSYEGAYSVELTAATDLSSLPNEVETNPGPIIYVANGQVRQTIGRIEFLVGGEQFSWPYTQIKQILNTQGEPLWRNDAYTQM